MCEYLIQEARKHQEKYPDYFTELDTRTAELNDLHSRMKVLQGDIMAYFDKWGVWDSGMLL